jgi:hypothetical protein
MTGSPPPVVKLWTFCEKKCATTSSRQRFDMDSGKGHSESAVPVHQLHPVAFVQTNGRAADFYSGRSCTTVGDGRDTRQRASEGIGSSLCSILKRFKTTSGGFGHRIARRFGCTSNYGALRGARGVAANGFRHAPPGLRGVPRAFGLRCFEFEENTHALCGRERFGANVASSQAR